MVQSYPFESPQAFLAEFGVLATVGTATATVILSMPGEDIMGGMIETNKYEIEYQTSSLTLAHGTVVVIAGITYKVIQVYPVDDGVFSRARLTT